MSAITPKADIRPTPLNVCWAKSRHYVSENKQAANGCGPDVDFQCAALPIVIPGVGLSASEW
jgi:hypothetical protein